MPNSTRKIHRITAFGGLILFFILLILGVYDRWIYYSIVAAILLETFGLKAGVEINGPDKTIRNYISFFGYRSGKTEKMPIYDLVVFRKSNPFEIYLSGRETGQRKIYSSRNQEETLRIASEVGEVMHLPLRQVEL